VLAISVAEENPQIKPAQPLYDVLPSATSGPADFSMNMSPSSVSIPQGRTATTRIIVMPRGKLDEDVQLSVSGLPEGVAASFHPASTAGSSTMSLTAEASSIPTTSNVTITGKSGTLSHTVTAAVEITPVLTGTVPVDLSSTYNVTGIYNDGSSFPDSAGLDGGGYAFSEQLLGFEQVGDGVVFKLGPPGAPDVVSGKTIALPPGKFTSLKVLAAGVNGEQEMQTFRVSYDDGSSSSFSQSLSDWAMPSNFPGESVAFTLPYRIGSDGSKDSRSFYGYAYSFDLDSNKSVRSISLPSNDNVLVFAMTLVPAKV
jgi:hypothetical protein